jgi:hypothetical protein
MHKSTTFLCMLVLPLALCGCREKLTPAQIAAIEKAVIAQTKIACKFIPVAEDIAKLIPTSSAAETVIGPIADAICKSLEGNETAKPEQRPELAIKRDQANPSNAQAERKVTVPVKTSLGTSATISGTYIR